MIKNEEQIKEIVEAIKKSMNLEELDDLEREYNRMYKEMKEKEEQKKASTTNES
jgi:ribonuclease HIII